jgi:hypothetical protein
MLEDVKLSNILLLGFVIIVIAFFAQFYKLFLENSDFLLAFISLNPFHTFYLVIVCVQLK